MSNIVNYINKYGNLTFDELKLNELDELIFGVLSYVDFDGILENNKYEKVFFNDDDRCCSVCICSLREDWRG